MWMREMLISDVQGIEGLWKDRESSQPRFQDFQLLAVTRKQEETRAEIRSQNQLLAEVQECQVGWKMLSWVGATLQQLEVSCQAIGSPTQAQKSNRKRGQGPNKLRQSSEWIVKKGELFGRRQELEYRSVQIQDVKSVICLISSMKCNGIRAEPRLALRRGQEKASRK